MPPDANKLSRRVFLGAYGLAARVAAARETAPGDTASVNGSRMNGSLLTFATRNSERIRVTPA
jgi:hypothetical protein